MFSKTHRFIIVQNWLICAACGLLLLAFVVSTLSGQPWVLWWGGLFEQAPAGFWNRFMPLAQFTAAGGLAYLALEMFRHSNAVHQKVKDFFGPTAEDRQGAVRSIKGLTIDEVEANKQLLILIYLFQLSDARAFWGRGRDLKPLKEFREEAKKTEAGIKKFRTEAENQAWFRSGTGRAYCHCFLKGLDTVLVAFGLLLSVMIHALASAEGAVMMFAPAFMFHWLFQVALMLVIFALGVILPLYYVFIGRKLMDEIQDIADMGGEQFLARKKERSRKDEGEVQEVVTNLRTRADNRAAEPRIARLRGAARAEPAAAGPDDEAGG